MNRQAQRLDVAFTIEWEASWHVGSGQGNVRADRLLRRRSAGGYSRRVPYVPGSQIKGVLRHQCERLAKLLGADVVSPHVTDRDSERQLLEAFRPLPRSQWLIDRLFGSRYQGECLFVEDALPRSADALIPVRLHSRTSIDRVTGTARDRTLFVTEVVESTSPALHSWLSARHPPGVLTQDGDGFPFEYSLLLAGLLSLDALGGDKSLGLGRCRIVVEGDAVRWNGRQMVPLAEALRSFSDLDEDWYAFLVDFRREGQS